LVGPCLTGDHLIKTRSGYVPVDELSRDSEIAIGEPSPNDILEQVIVGSFLGDAHIARSCYTESHGDSQKSYIAYKVRCLRGFSPYHGDTVSTGHGKSFPSHYMGTLCSTYFREMREKFYQRGKKVITPITNLTDLAVAVWYMDDGSISSYRKSCRAEFATNSFTREEVDFLCGLLLSAGFSGAHPVFSNGWRISIGAGHADSFYRRIAKYIIPSMRYKLPEEYHSIPFEDFASKCKVVNHWVSGLVIKEVPCPEKSVYCLDVRKNHNFVAGGIVVHNCYTPGNRHPTGQSWTRK